jgi:lysophospholipase L1-like esterase
MYDLNINKAVDCNTEASRRRVARGKRSSMNTIVCFGDSNTWGCPPFANIAQTPDRLPPHQRWPNVLGRYLGEDTWIVEEGLSGRTTVFDDPIEGLHKNGMRTIIPVLESHAPLDVLIIMLGGNDFKEQYGISAYNSARGMLTLIQTIKGHYALIDTCPEILIVTPPAITDLAEPAMWGEGWKKCIDHAYYLEQVANRTGCFHYDANRVAKTGMDGCHLEPEEHEALGRALAEEVRSILKLRQTK